MFVNTSGGAERLADRAVAAAALEDDAASLLAHDVSAAFAALEPELQRAVCLMTDHDDVVAEYGETSPQASLARELYAAAMVDAAVHGYEIDALQPLLSAISPHGNAPGQQARVLLGLCSLEDIFDERYDGHLFAFGAKSIGIDVVMAAKKNASPDIFTERQMSGRVWDEPKQVEIGKLERLGAMSPIAADDPIAKDKSVINTMWTGRLKRKSDRTVDKWSARCVLRGDLHGRTYGIDANRSMSPVVRNSSIMCVDAVSCIRGQHMRPYDVTGAYLHGEQTETEQVIARPPVGFRQFDERGVEILWLMWVPLYGQTDAGAIWNRTINAFQTGPDMNYERSANDPCVYSKEVESDGSRVTMPLYVDDGRWYFDDTVEAKPTAEKDMEAFGKKFEVRFNDVNPREDYFLGGNRISPSRDVCSVRCTTYIDSMVERYADGDVSPSKRFPAFWSHTPADETLVREFEAACATRTPATTELTKRYGSLIGALIHAVKTLVGSQSA